MANAGGVWITRHQDVEGFKAKVSAHQFSNQTLEKLCLAKVADTIHYHCKARKDPPKALLGLVEIHKPRLYKEILRSKSSIADIKDIVPYLVMKQDPFQNLTPYLMKSLQLFLEERKIAFSPRVLPCLVTENSERLVAHIDRNEWSRKELLTLFNRIREKGTNITELDLCLDNWEKKDVNIPRLRELLGTTRKLVKLKIKFDKMDNRCLNAIRSDLPSQLRCVEISSSDVTDDGMYYLCAPSVQPNSEYKKLTHLNINLCSNVTVSGTVVALTLLPDLLWLDTDFLYEAIVTLVELNENLKLKLQYLKCIEDSTINSNVDINKLESVISAVPDIKKIEISVSHFQKVEIFMKLQHIVDITFIDVFFWKPADVSLFVTNYCNQLTKLTIKHTLKYVDITIIGFHCLNLEELNWGIPCDDFDDVNECPKYTLHPYTHFSKLKTVDFSTDGEFEFYLPDQVLKCILVSPNLENFKIHQYDLSPESIPWVIDEARVTEEIFTNVKELKLLCEDISALQTIQMLCLAPKLKMLHVCSINADEVQNFLLQHHLNHIEFQSVML